jgi:POT family proton-dependent oligopeptide transporter
VKLIPATYDKAGRKVGETPIIAMEQLTLGEVKDEAIRGAIRKAVESNLVENTKKFLGFPIKTLYDFFMLFVVMSGVSAVVLFLLSRRLLHMMHGVR